jgi:hypothetical protein
MASFVNDAANGWIVVDILGLLIIIAIAVYAAAWSGTHSFEWSVYDAAYVASAWYRRGFLPRGVWSTDQHGYHAQLYDLYKPSNEHYAYSTHITFLAVFGILTAYNSPARCELVIVLTAGWLGIGCLVVLWRKPYRDHATNGFRIANYLCQALFMLGDYYLSEFNGYFIHVLMALEVTEGMSGIVVTFWEQLNKKKALLPGSKHEEELLNDTKFIKIK